MSEQTTTTQQQAATTSANADLSFCVSNNALNKALKTLSGIVDHSQVIQILGYIKCELVDKRLLLIASNSEIEIHVTIPVISTQSTTSSCTFTLPCRKLFDITRSLDPDTVLQIKNVNSWTEVAIAKTRFKLASLPQTIFHSWHNLLRKNYKNF